MHVVRHLVGGPCPEPMDMIYNTDLEGNGTNQRYKGSMVKFMDYDDINTGTFLTDASLATANENIFGILEEDVAASTTFLPNAAAATGDFVRKKITPIDGFSIIRAEYAQYDRAGTATHDVGFAGSAASASMTCTSQGTADCNIGAWLYFIDGSNAGYLHYILDNDNTTGITLRTVLVNAVTATDKVLVICPPFTRTLDFNATGTDLKSEIVLASRSENVFGLDYHIKATGQELTKLTLDMDGTQINNAKFFHDFVMPVSNLFTSGVATS